MTTEKSPNLTLKLLLLALGMLFLGFFHFFALRETPGLHFDEAWAMNFSWRIATDPGFWPLTAQSPYTSPWAHYWAALWMKAFGPGIFVFRFSQALLSLGGLFFLGLALWKSKLRRALYWLPLAAAFLPGLALNHRFAIELNGLHALCLGLFIWGIQRSPWITALAWVVGTTAHILFFAVGFSLLSAIIWDQRNIRHNDRVAGLSASLVLALFFLRVAFLIPETGKGASLVLVSLATAAGYWFPVHRWLPRPRWIAPVVGAAAFAFLANAAFFLEGSWPVAISTGLQPWERFGIVGIILFLPLTLWLIWRGSRDLPRLYRRWFLLGVIALGAMMLKPAPRYFETAFLVAAVFSAVGLASIRAVPRFLALIVFALHAVWLYPLYFLTVPKEESLRLLLWKDSSRDFLSKQRLTDVLGGSGCSLFDIQSVDSRVRESLLALSRSDWDVKPGGCTWKELRVTRRSEAEAGSDREEAADFVLWGTR